MSQDKPVLSPSDIYLCRASGEGSHNFRLCEDEKAVIAFYAEIFGPDYDGKFDSTIEHFRDPDNWSNSGTEYSCDLYNAKWEVWIVERSDLALSTLDRQGWISVEERLPEIGDRVLVSWCNAYGKRKVGERVRLIEYEEATTFYWSYWHSRDGLLTQKAVTHWMPLPSAPHASAQINEPDY